MEIKDAISLYTFLGQLGVLGAISFSIIIIVLIGYLVSLTTEKTIDNSKARRQVLVITLLVVAFCMGILINNSKNNLANISNATAIKAYMVSMKWKWLGYKRLAKDVNLPDMPALGNSEDNILIQKRIHYIQDVVSKFPDEFEITTVYDNLSKDSMGIELIDTNAMNVINRYNVEMLPFFTSKLIDYMNSTHKDTLSYNAISDNIDNRLQSYLIDKIVTNSSGIFIPTNTLDGDGLIYKH